MEKSRHKQKLYCYVDESGQDDTSGVFVVVAVVSDRDPEKLRDALIATEQNSGVGRSKWHDAKPPRRKRYLELVLERKLGHEEVFFGAYPKPLPFFFPMIEVVERAIKAKASPPYAARVFVDGIDRLKAAELTNALRLRGVSLEMVRSRRDESEPVIRLADMWAGCIRGANLGKPDEREILRRAIAVKSITHLKEKTP